MEEDLRVLILQLLSIEAVSDWSTCLFTEVKAMHPGDTQLCVEHRERDHICLWGKNVTYVFCNFQWNIVSKIYTLSSCSNVIVSSLGLGVPYDHAIPIRRLKSVHLLRSMARREGQAEFFSHHVSLHMGPKDKDLTLIPQVVEWLKHFILFRCTWVQLPAYCGAASSKEVC